MVLEIQEEGIGRGIDGPFKSPEELPHGLLVVPEIVIQAVDRLATKLLPLVATPEFRQKHVNRYTVDYYFRGYGQDVVYRSTPAGPEVLAVGFINRLEFEKASGMSPEEFRQAFEVDRL